MSEATLYEHEDGRYAVAPGQDSPAFTHGDPKWHRVGPVDVAALTSAPAEPTEAMLAAGGRFSSQPRATYKAMLAAAPAETPAAAGAAQAGALTPIQRDLLRNLGAAVASERSREKGDAWDQLAELLRDLSTCAPSPLPASPAATSAAAQAVAWRDIASAPKDGTLLRLLVNFEDHPTEDGEGPQPTIGSHHDDIGWQFVGWDWYRDQWTNGVGTPIGWLPMVDALAALSQTPPQASGKDGAGEVVALIHQLGEALDFYVSQAHTAKGAAAIEAYRAFQATPATPPQEETGSLLEEAAEFIRSNMDCLRVPAATELLARIDAVQPIEREDGK